MALIGIIETGRPNETLAREYGTYPQILCAYFTCPNTDFRVFNVYDGPLPDPDACTGWILSGSAHAVYEPHAWIPPLMDFVREAMQRKRPLLGICFGHQLMAQALGGTVVKSPKGWGLGVHEYRTTDIGRQRLPDQDHFKLYAVHQDQVIEQPPGSEVLATSEFCPYAALAYGTTGLSFQSHPEYSAAYERALINYLRARIPPTTVEAALKTLDEPVHSGLLMDVLRDFLTRS